MRGVGDIGVAVSGGRLVRDNPDAPYRWRGRHGDGSIESRNVDGLEIYNKK